MEIIKKNTAVICLSPYGGGMELNAIKLCKKISKITPVTLIAQEDKFIAKQNNILFGEEIFLETIKFSSNLGFSLIVGLRKIIKTRYIKNIIFFGASELKSLYFSLLGLDVNLIVRHGTTKSTPKKDWFHKLIYSNVNYHITNSKHLEKNVQYIIPFGKNTKSQVIYTSFILNDTNYTPHATLTLVHVGRIARGKGQIDAIKACQVFVDNDIDFIFNIVGDIEEGYKNEFESFFNTISYKDKINLVGFTNNVNKYLSSADIFLFPSHGEGLSNAFLEALKYNLLCIVYNNTSFPELIELGLYFKMANNLDILDLQKVLLLSIKDLKQEKIKVEKNFEVIKKLFSLENELKQYEQILI